MAEHYTRGTESYTAWCNRCNRDTQHRWPGRDCLDCFARLEARVAKEAEARRREETERRKQGSLFGA